MKTYEELREEYGIIHVGKDLFETLNPDDMIGYTKETYSYTVLIKNRSSVQKVFPDLEVKRPTVEEIMLFYCKGGC